MIPTRESCINSLIHYRLALRRLYRSWRRSKPLDRDRGRDRDDARSPLSTAGFNDDHHSLSTRPRRPAQLPASPPDSNPISLPLLVLLLFTFALGVRGWSVAYPPSVVFDEVHFLRFIRAYYYGEYFFDIHPPLGKLVLLIVTHLFCGEPKVEYDSNGAEFHTYNYLPLRITSAIFGSCVSPLTYLIARELGLSSAASLFAALAQAVEHLAVIESRLILLDAQLMMWMALCLLCALRLWGCTTDKDTTVAAKPVSSVRRWLLVVATAVAGACTLSVKWTSLATPALVAIVSLAGAPFAARRLRWVEMAVAGGIAMSIYVSLFWMHFALLPKSGRGDAFMKHEFQRTLIGNRAYKKSYRSPGFWRNFVYLNWEMYTANKGITARHTWESKWWQWVINQRGLLYYSQPDEDFDTQKIYLVVNPAVTIITCVALPLFLVIGVVWAVKRLRRTIPAKKSIERRRMSAFMVRGTFLFAGYILNLLPYIGKCGAALSASISCPPVPPFPS